MNLIKFGETLKELIDDRQMTAKAFASELGLSASTITRYINAKRMPEISNLVLIADYFNCSIDFLFGREPEQNLIFKKCPPFSEQIVFLSKHFCSTNEAFYEIAKVHSSTFYEWKCGSSIPTIESIINLADIFERRIDFIIGRET